MVLVPDVLERTPPYVDRVRAGSPAETRGHQARRSGGVVGEDLVKSCKGLREELARVERDAESEDRADARSGADRN